MEIGEAISVGVADIKSQESLKCPGKEAPPDWKARVNGKGTDPTECSGEELYKSLVARGDAAHRASGLGVIPEKKPDAHWAAVGLSGVTQSSFPVQAHHLIPKNHLPDHDVCNCLCKKNGLLSGDTPYNTDGANNGYCMPYASKLKEWTGATAKRKVEVAFAVMRRTRVQLHQGSHAATLDNSKLQNVLDKGELPAIEPQPAPSSDAMEENIIHTKGYLHAITDWLNTVHEVAAEHEESCDACKDARKKGNGKGRPIGDIVRLMDRVSYIAKVFLEMDLIFTCPYSWAYAKSEPRLSWDSTNMRFEIGDAEFRPKTTAQDIRRALSRRGR